MSSSAGKSTIVIACGGTGGHFFPGLATALEIRKRGGTPVMFIGGHRAAALITEARGHGLEVIYVATTRVPRSRWLMPVFAVKLAFCVISNAFRLIGCRADAVLVMGSFASVPTGLAAAFLRRPLYVHEGNAVMGRANRLLSRWARTVALSFPLANMERPLPGHRHVGMPLRQAVLEAGEGPPTNGDMTRAKADLGLDPSLPVLLVFGGSQGAVQINRLMEEMLGHLNGVRSFQVIHLTGTEDNDAMKSTYDKAQILATVKAKEDEMQRLYPAADLVVCRAGGSTIAELAYFGRAAAYVPLATSMDNHQLANAALAAVCTRGGYLLDKDDGRAARLAEIVSRWLENPDDVRERAGNIRSLARPRAGVDLAELVLSEVAVQ